MEERSLRKKLIRLYIVSIALVLSLVFAITALFTLRDERQTGRESFLTLFTLIAERLQTDSTIQHSLLRKYEQQNQIHYFITDAGSSLQYNSDDGDMAVALSNRVKAGAAQMGVDINAIPLTAQRVTSPVLEFRHDGVSYYGAASVIPLRNSFRTLVAAQKTTRHNGWRYAFFGAAYLLSALGLGFLGIRLIDRALRPAIESRARQTEFIAAASHELRAPLAVIQANAATVSAMPERALAAADTIAAECERMSRLIGDMLLLASTDAKAWPVTFARLEPDTLLLEVYEAYVPVCARRGFSLTLKLPEHALPARMADAARFKQVLSILLDNAMHYSAAASDKRICIMADVKKDKIFIDVIDHGPGIPDAQKPHIFDRFYRGDKARGAKQHFGLGLAIARELIRLHGGSISVSDTPGGGGTFRILL